MSFESGMKALNLEFSDKVPRTEYSLRLHTELLEHVTGISVKDQESRQDAYRELMRKWDYAINIGVNVGKPWLEKNGGRVTYLGHAAYRNNAEDLNEHQHCPFSDVEEVYSLDPCSEYGEFDKKELIQELEAGYKQKVALDGGYCVSTGGVYITMVSGLLDILGWEMFLMAIAIDEKKMGKLIDGYYEWIKQFYDAYAESNVPVLMCHDDMFWTSGAFAPPEWYRKYIFPKVKKLFTPLREAGKKIVFVSDGTFTDFFDDIVEMGVDTVVMEPTNDMALFAKKYGKTHGFVGGVDCRVLQLGSKEDIRNAVESCMNQFKEYPGYIFATGNHLPPNLSLDSCLYYNEIYEQSRTR